MWTGVWLVVGDGGEGSSGQTHHHLSIISHSWSVILSSDDVAVSNLSYTVPQCHTDHRVGKFEFEFCSGLEFYRPGVSLNLNGFNGALGRRIIKMIIQRHRPEGEAGELRKGEMCERGGGGVRKREMSSSLVPSFSTTILAIAALSAMGVANNWVSYVF